jgi:predicted O-methyltransferase YrrM
MNGGPKAASTNPVTRIVAGLRWRADGLRVRMRAVQAEGVADHLRCRVELGFPLPPLDGMQNYQRLKFLYDCIRRFAPASGVALEVGCYKCTSTVFIANACKKANIRNIYAMDLFTGTPSWNTPGDYFETARQKLARYGLGDRVTLLRSNSLEYPWKEPIAILHIDADHEYQAVWNDIQKYIPFLVVDGIVVFDDYDVSHAGVTKAVHRLLAEEPRFEVVAANYQGVEFGSLCLRRTGR